MTLRSGVAGKTIELVDLCEEPYLLNAEDIVILASDGVETLPENDLATRFNNPCKKPMQTLAGNLMTQIEATSHEGQDNASVILYQH